MNSICIWRYCTICEKSLDKGELKSGHFKKHHPEYKFKYSPWSGSLQCTTCDKTVITFRNLIRHYSKYHPHLLNKGARGNPG